MSNRYTYKFEEPTHSSVVVFIHRLDEDGDVADGVDTFKVIRSENCRSAEEESMKGMYERAQAEAKKRIADLKESEDLCNQYNKQAGF